MSSDREPLIDGMTFFPGEGVLALRPHTIRSRKGRPSAGEQLVNSWQIDRTRAEVVDELRSTLASFRDKANPRTALGALVVRDGQSLEEVESRTQLDPESLQHRMLLLEKIGVVSREVDHGVERFSLVPPETI